MINVCEGMETAVYCRNCGGLRLAVVKEMGGVVRCRRIVVLKQTDAVSFSRQDTVQYR
jgi:hypothetical protein